MAAVSEIPVRWNADETVCADAVRLALAHRIGAQVVTADTRFANALATTEHGGAVAMLADYGKEGH